MTYYVTHVRYDENDNVIEKVKCKDGSVYTKKQMIIWLTYGSIAYTYYDSHVTIFILLIMNI